MNTMTLCCTLVRVIEWFGPLFLPSASHNTGTHSHRRVFLESTFKNTSQSDRKKFVWSSGNRTFCPNSALRRYAVAFSDVRLSIPMVRKVHCMKFLHVCSHVVAAVWSDTSVCMFLSNWHSLKLSLLCFWTFPQFLWPSGHSQLCRDRSEPFSLVWIPTDFKRKYVSSNCKDFFQLLKVDHQSDCMAKENY